MQGDVIARIGALESAASLAAAAGTDGGERRGAGSTGLTVGSGGGLTEEALRPLQVMNADYEDCVINNMDDGTKRGIFYLIVGETECIA